MDIDNLPDIDSRVEVNDFDLTEKIVNIIDSILESAYRGNADRTKAIRRGKSYNFCCPVCGDSKFSDSEKRGHFYFGNFNFKCYNGSHDFCSKSPHSIVDFLKQFDKANLLTADEINRLYTIRKSTYDASGSATVHKFTGSSIFDYKDLAMRRSDLYTVFDIKVKYGEKEFMRRSRIIDVEKDDKIMEYLKSRLQIPKDGDTRHFMYNINDDQLLILNLTPDREHFIGLQVRNQKAQKGVKTIPRFLTYNWEDCQRNLFLKNLPENDHSEINKWSMVYNILNIDIKKEVPVFEAAIDSHHMSNSLAMLSSSSKIFLDNGRYFFDYDKAGTLSAKDVLDKGFHVFLWEKFLDRYPIYKSLLINGKIDLNDIMRRQIVTEDILLQYFSNNELDLIYI